MFKSNFNGIRRSERLYFAIVFSMVTAIAQADTRLDSDFLKVSAFILDGVESTDIDKDGKRKYDIFAGQVKYSGDETACTFTVESVKKSDDLGYGKTEEHYRKVTVFWNKFLISELSAAPYSGLVKITLPAEAGSEAISTSSTDKGFQDGKLTYVEDGQKGIWSDSLQIFAGSFSEWNPDNSRRLKALKYLYSKFCKSAVRSTPY